VGFQQDVVAVFQLCFDFLTVAGLMAKGARTNIPALALSVVACFHDDCLSMY
jgi:hypothetical protein